MHPSYLDAKVTVDKFPYLLSRTAYLPFIVGCEIHFHESAEVEPLRIDHLLEFKGSGKIYKKYLKIGIKKLKVGVTNLAQDRKRMLKLNSNLSQIAGEATVIRKEFFEDLSELNFMKSAICNGQLPDSKKPQNFRDKSQDFLNKLLGKD